MGSRDISFPLVLELGAVLLLSVYCGASQCDRNDAILVVALLSATTKSLRE